MFVLLQFVMSNIDKVRIIVVGDSGKQFVVIKNNFSFLSSASIHREQKCSEIISR